jgi:hypothetical protein
VVVVMMVVIMVAAEVRCDRGSVKPGGSNTWQVQLLQDAGTLTPSYFKRDSSNWSHA